MDLSDHCREEKGWSRRKLSKSTRRVHAGSAAERWTCAAPPPASTTPPLRPGDSQRCPRKSTTGNAFELRKGGEEENRRGAMPTVAVAQFRRRCVSSADHQFQGQMPRQIHSRHGEPKPRKNGITRSSLEQINNRSVLQPTRIQVYTQFSQGKFNQTHPR